MDAQILKKTRDAARLTDTVFVKCMEHIEGQKKDAASHGRPYFEAALGDKPVNVIESVLDTLQCQGYHRVYFDYPTSGGYAVEWIKYENDNFKSCTGYGTKIK